MSLATDDHVVRVLRVIADRWLHVEAEDLLSDGLLAILEAEAAGKHAPDGVDPGAWAVNVAKSKMGHVVRAWHLSHHCQTIFHRASLVRRPIDWDTAAVDVSRYMTELAPRQRRAVELRIWGPMSWDEAGREMGVQAKTAKSNYMQAIRKLRKRFT